MEKDWKDMLEINMNQEGFSKVMIGTSPLDTEILEDGEITVQEIMFPTIFIDDTKIVLKGDIQIVVGSQDIIIQTWR